jgi:hypothetical protein
VFQAEGFQQDAFQAGLFPLRGGFQAYGYQGYAFQVGVIPQTPAPPSTGGPRRIFDEWWYRNQS